MKFFVSKKITEIHFSVICIITVIVDFNIN